jgi:uncharacterized protein YceH (UPF0502 family)
MQLDRTERRILGSLIEKRWATPDQYPLSLNALVAACNQKSNRDPVLALEEFEISGCLLGLREKGLVLIRERDGGRVQRYAERLGEELSLPPLAEAVVAELLLRGAQTAAELSRRVKRMVSVDGVGPVEECLAELARTQMVRLRAREPGQRHARWEHRLAAEDAGPAEEAPESPTPQTAPAPKAAVPPPPPAPEKPCAPEDPSADEPAPADLRKEVEELRREVAALRERLSRIEAVVL